MPETNTLLTSDQIVLSFHYLAALGALFLFLFEGALIASMVWLRSGNDAAEGAPSSNA